MIAKTKVRSAMFDPKSTPSPKDGTPLNAELTAMNASGRMEIMATMIKPTVYFDRRKLSARRAAYFVASVAPFMTMNKERMKMNTLLSMALRVGTREKTIGVLRTFFLYFSRNFM